MPKAKETGTTAVYENNGQKFKAKKVADNYGVIVEQVTAFAEASDLEQDFVDAAMEAYRAGAFSLPKVSR